MLNDPVYVDAARGFAKRVLTDSTDVSPAARLRHAFQLCLTREPSAREIAALDALLQQQLIRYNADPAAAKAIAAKFAPPANVSAAEFAAWHAITTALLNLDETITKG